MDYRDLHFFPIKLNRFIEFILSYMEEGFSKGLGVLMILQEYGPMPISHIGDRLFVRKSNMTGIIDDLEEKDWVQRCASPEDRRVINIELTDRGKMALEEKLDKINHVINERISVLSSEEIQSGTQAMKDLTETMTKIIEKNGKK